VFETFRSVTFPELAKQGFVEGTNLVCRDAGSARPEKAVRACPRACGLPDPMRSLPSADGAIRAIQQASSTIPIVGSFIGEDPIAAGVRGEPWPGPGGKVTGIVMLAPELDAKAAEYPT